MSDKDYRIFYDNYMKTNAATEATGLIPCSPDSSEEWDAYRNIFDFEPACYNTPDLPTEKIKQPKKE